MGSRLAGKAAFVFGGASGLGDLLEGFGTDVETATGRARMAGINLTGVLNGMTAAVSDARTCSTRAPMIYPAQVRTPEPGDLTPEQDAARSKAIQMCIAGNPMDVAN